MVNLLLKTVVGKPDTMATRFFCSDKDNSMNHATNKLQGVHLRNLCTNLPWVLV